MGRTSALAPPAENTPGGATILPGVPLPLWGRPTEPVQPDPSPSAGPAPEAEVTGPASWSAPDPEEARDDAVVEAGSVPDSQPEPTAPAEAAQVDAQPTAPAEAAQVDAEPTAPAEATQVDAELQAPAASPEPTAPAEATQVDAEPLAPDAWPEPHDDDVAPRDELAEALAAPVPALDPPLPAAPVAAAYAAAGAAPPNAPWGTEPDPTPQAPPPAPFPTPAPAQVQLPDPVPELAPASAPVDLAPPVEGTALPGPGSHRAPGPTGTATSRSWTSDRRPLVLLGALGAVLVLGAVAAFGWPGFLVAQDDSAGVVPPAPAAAGAPVTLRAAASAAGLSVVSGPAADALTKASGATAIAGYTAPVSAVYGTGRTPVATVIAWTALTRGRPAELSTAFAGFQGATGKVVTAITPAPTGALGGRMSCGSSVVGTTPASVCFWSDDATFGAITVLRPTSAAQGVATATALRAAVEHRG